jgi:hypothetical protein
VFSWLWHNKEWLFSGIGGVAFLGLLGFVYKWWKRRGASENKSETIIRPLGSVSATGILATIDSSPLLQRKEVTNHYIGLQVSWDGHLASADITKGNIIRITVLIKDKLRRAYIFAYVDSTQYPGLGLLKSGHPIHIDGTIKEIAGWIILKDATIKFSL